MDYCYKTVDKHYFPSQITILSAAFSTKQAAGNAGTYNLWWHLVPV
jgi:hypothetical protein